MPIDRRTVELAYRFLLGREPDSEAVIDDAVEHYQDLDHLRLEMMHGSEFRTNATYALSHTRAQWKFKELADGLYLPLDMSDRGVSLPILWSGEWEPATTALILSKIDADSVFLDIGANVGWFSILAGSRLRRLGGRGKVIAFEMQPDVARRLQSAVFLSALQNHVDVHAVALSDSMSVAEVGLRPDGNRGGAFVRPFSADASHAVVPCVTLDSLLARADRIDLIKMDIEGSELKALRGSSALLKRFSPELIIEINDEMLQQVSGGGTAELLGFLDEHGYTCAAQCGQPPREGGLSSEQIKGIVGREKYPNFLFQPR